MTTDAQKEKQIELTSIKKTLETEITNLKTKEGSEQFITEQKTVCDGVLNKKPRITSTVEGRVTMTQLLQIKRNTLEKLPKIAIADKIRAAEKRLTVIDKEIKELTDEAR